MQRITEKELEELPLQKLEEMLVRQENLMKKTCVLSKLVDKGASVRKTHELLKNEIENRQLVESFSNLNLNDSGPLDKHVQYLCAKETNFEGVRFKPFATLKNSTAEIKHGMVDNTGISAAVEPKWSHSSAKCIPLKESLKLQEEHVRKLKDEQAKRLVSELELVEGTVEENEAAQTETEPPVLTSED